MEGKLVVEFLHGLLGYSNEEELDSALSEASILIKWKLF